MSDFQAFLKSHLESVIKAPVDEKDVDVLVYHLKKKTFEKKEHLLSEGRISDEIFFLSRGSCYSYITDKKGEPAVVQFALEGYWIGDLYSFFSGKPAIYSICAIEETTVWALDRAGFDTVCREVAVFDTFFRILLQNAYTGLQMRYAQSITEDAKTRYEQLIRRQPGFQQRIPQYLLASWLGIRPQSLSRIRRDLAKKRG